MPKKKDVFEDDGDGERLSLNETIFTEKKDTKLYYKGEYKKYIGMVEVYKKTVDVMRGVIVLVSLIAMVAIIWG